MIYYFVERNEISTDFKNKVQLSVKTIPWNNFLNAPEIKIEHLSNESRLLFKLKRSVYFIYKIFLLYLLAIKMKVYFYMLANFPFAKISFRQNKKSENAKNSNV